MRGSVRQPFRGASVIVSENGLAAEEPLTGWDQRQRAALESGWDRFERAAGGRSLSDELIDERHRDSWLAG